MEAEALTEYWLWEVQLLEAEAEAGVGVELLIVPYPSRNYSRYPGALA